VSGAAPVQLFSTTTPGVTNKFAVWCPFLDAFFIQDGDDIRAIYYNGTEWKLTANYSSGMTLPKHGIAAASFSPVVFGDGANGPELKFALLNKANNSIDVVSMAVLGSPSSAAAIASNGASYAAVTQAGGYYYFVNEFAINGPSYCSAASGDCVILPYADGFVVADNVANKLVHMSETGVQRETAGNEQVYAGALIPNTSFGYTRTSAGIQSWNTSGTGPATQEASAAIGNFNALVTRGLLLTRSSSGHDVILSNLSEGSYTTDDKLIGLYAANATAGDEVGVATNGDVVGVPTSLTPKLDVYANNGALNQTEEGEKLGYALGVATLKVQLTQAAAASAKTTTSISAVYGAEGAYTPARANVKATLAQALELSDGTAVASGEVSWPSHGLTVGSSYWLDTATAGGYIETEPSTGFSQPLFYVPNADAILVNVKSAQQMGVATYPQHVSLFSGAFAGSAEGYDANGAEYTVTASSEYSASYAIALVIGRLGYDHATLGVNGLNEWSVQAAFGIPKYVSKYLIRGRSPHSEGPIRFRMDYSDDGSTWLQGVEHSHPAFGAGSEVVRAFETAVTTAHKYWKLVVVESSNMNPGLGYFDLIGADA